MARSAHNNEQKLLSLSLDEFLRRFLLHVLPKGFVRIRHFGFLANRRRATTLPLCLPLLGSSPQPRPEVTAATSSDAWLCPRCSGPMLVNRKVYSCGDPTPFSANPRRHCRMRSISTSRNSRMSRGAQYRCVFLSYQFLLRTSGHPLSIELTNIYRPFPPVWPLGALRTRYTYLCHLNCIIIASAVKRKASCRCIKARKSPCSCPRPR